MKATIKKPRKCRCGCGAVFIPTRPLQTVAEPSCALKLIERRKAKQAEQQAKVERQQIKEGKTNSKLGGITSMKRKKPAMIMFATATEISPAFAAGSHLEQLLMGKLAECLTPAITEALEAHRIYGSTLIRTYMDNGNPVIAMVPVEQWITGLD